MYCEKCGAKNEEGTKFCTSCGADIGESVEGQYTVNNGTVRKTIPGFAKKIIISVVSVAVIAGAGVLGYNFISNTFGSNNDGYENHPIIYAKDKMLYMKNVNKKEAYPLTKKDGYYEYNDFGSAFTNMVQMSSDGKLVFFTDERIRNLSYIIAKQIKKFLRVMVQIKKV